MRFILLGAPGVGKGTQAKNISEKFDICHVSTGDILRAEIKEKTALGIKAAEYVNSGKLVPDDLIIEMIKSEFKSGKFDKGFLMDGFPRTIEQAVKLNELLEELGLKIDKVFNIIVDEEEILRRLTGRMVCTSCKKIFKTGDFKEEADHVCNSCGSIIYKRDDDSEEVIAKRLNIYRKQTEPLVKFYKDSGVLADIDGLGSEEDIFERILSSI